MRRLLAGSSAVAAAAVLAGSAFAGDNNAGFRTSQPAMLTAFGSASATALVTVGDTLGSGYRYEAIPDGIAVRPRGNGRADVYVSHETSLVPFPFNSVTMTGLTDYDNAMVSRLAFNQHSAGVLQGWYDIPSEGNYQRFCSIFLAGPEQGWDRELLFANEEATDTVNRIGTAWPATPLYGSNPEQAGLVVALDIRTGQHRPIYGMGRHNHENSVAIPGYDDAVVLSGDDTFSAPASQLYLYRADDADAVWADEGHLYAFKANGAANDYGDVSGAGWVSGTFVPVPDAIADGNQTGLETWSNANDVFQFIRVEDIAYDRTNPNVVYFADTGEPRAKPSLTSSRLVRSSTGGGPYPNGRIWKLTLDPSDPLVVQRLEILFDADAGGYSNPFAMHNPDNVETTASSLLVQEDPGSHNPYYSRLWRYDFATQSWSIAAQVSAAAAPGAWENSGVVDASAAFGAGAFLVNVQAHTILLDPSPHPDFPGITRKREGGQLLLVRIPGA